MTPAANGNKIGDWSDSDYSQNIVGPVYLEPSRSLLLLFNMGQRADAYG